MAMNLKHVRYFELPTFNSSVVQKGSTESYKTCCFDQDLFSVRRYG
jgi:hypothetical protein